MIRQNNDIEKSFRKKEKKKKKDGKELLLKITGNLNHLQKYSICNRSP